jgi:hypothetical protein
VRTNWPERANRPPYRPRQDSIVRIEARRLRSKLQEYYEGEGKGDPIFIYFRPGSYVPVFRSRGSSITIRYRLLLPKTAFSLMVLDLQ